MRKAHDKAPKLLTKPAFRPDDEIDTSDIPEIREIPANAVIGKFYRPVKHSVTLRIDADVLAWLKSGGDGYQTRINRYLRAAMHRMDKAS